MRELTFSHKDIQTMEKRFRTRLVNSISGFKSANLIGTRDQQGQENLAIVSSVVHLGSHPPLLALLFVRVKRQDTRFKTSLKPRRSQ